MLKGGKSPIFCQYTNVWHPVGYSVADILKHNAYIYSLVFDLTNPWRWPTNSDYENVISCPAPMPCLSFIFKVITHSSLACFRWLACSTQLPFNKINSCVMCHNTRIRTCSDLIYQSALHSVSIKLNPQNIQTNQQHIIASQRPLLNIWVSVLNSKKNTGAGMLSVAWLVWRLAIFLQGAWLVDR